MNSAPIFRSSVMNEKVLLTYCGNLESVKRYPDAWKCFVRRMEGYQYGEDETINAWWFFYMGYEDGAVADH